MMRARLTRRLICLLAGASALAGCSARRVRDQLVPGSEAYAPAMRVWVTTQVKRGELTAVVDSGRISIPGAKLANPPVLARNLYATMIIARPDTLQTVTPGVRGDRRRWHPVATSDSVLIVEALRYGEEVPVPRLRFRVQDAAPALAGQRYLVIRISGDAVNYHAPVSAGDQPTATLEKGGVRVYSCSVAAAADSGQVSRVISRGC